MAQVDKPDKTLGEKMQSMPRLALYGILMVVCTIPLFFDKLTVPNKPADAAIDFFVKLDQIQDETPQGERATVLIASDWTNSTRGESAGQFEALLRILMRRNMRFAVYTSADPQAPQVARDVIMGINQERAANNEQPYRQWEDYVVMGYFPNAEATANAIRANASATFGNKKAVNPGGQILPVTQSPVLQNYTKIEQFPLLIVVTASKTSNITIERLYGKVPLAMMVTGVMGPETQVYYASGQLVGLSAGLKGVYDLETMMESGVNTENGVKSEKHRGNVVDGWPGMINKGKGTLYYPTLHFALALLILAVLIGNVGMAMSRRREA